MRSLQSLVADVRPVRRLLEPSERCARWLGFSLAFLIVGAWLGGVRLDLAEKSRDASFLLENGALLMVFALAARSAFGLSVPNDERPLGTFSLPLVALLLWLGLVLVRGWRQVDTGAFELATKTGEACVWRIVILGMPPVFACWVMLRRAAPLLRRWVGLFLSLSAFSLAAAGTRALCTIDGPLHVLLWHGPPVLLLALAGGGLGRVVFHDVTSSGR
ncbi:MAG TPA: NrsF family protein [Polyangiaceae bacterium]|nr:NrsF family protein [Polyangiaceae bacterium]